MRELAEVDELLDLLAGLGGAGVDAAWAELSGGYRDGRATPRPDRLTAAHVRAYATGRAPATIAALRSALTEAQDRIDGWAPRSVLDVGAGLGTASWVAMAALPSITSGALVERAPAMIDAGRQLAAGSSNPAVADRRWIRGDAAELGDERADLVVAGYVLSELDHRAGSGAIDAWWAATEGQLIIVDTGTPAGFDRVLHARSKLLDAGAHLVAPCPSEGWCPMADVDWCHFSVRLERSAAHRALKGADLPYEDEKFSYVIASRTPVRPARGRVIRHPVARTGHVRLQVCHDDAVTDEVVAKSRGDLYRWARKAGWGDAVPPELLESGS